MAQMHKKVVPSKEATTAPAVDSASNDTQTSQPEMLNLIREQQKQIESLIDMVKKTGNPNKLAEYEREKRQFEGFAFSLKLFPTSTWNKVVTKWENIKDFVASEGRIVDQQVKITYDNDGTPETETMILVDFSRRLLKSPKILATRIENEDGSEVLIDMRVNEETKRFFPVMRPKSDTFYAILNYEGKEYRISSTYLNA